MKVLQEKHSVTGRDRVRRALTFQSPDRAPRELWVLPFCALDDGRGSVVAKCEWGNDVSRANVEAVFETWQGDRAA